MHLRRKHHSRTLHWVSERSGSKLRRVCPLLRTLPGSVVDPTNPPSHHSSTPAAFWYVVGCWFCSKGGVYGWFVLVPNDTLASFPSFKFLASPLSIPSMIFGVLVASESVSAHLFVICSVQPSCAPTLPVPESIHIPQF